MIHGLDDTPGRIVEEVGSEVATVKPGDFVVGSFVISCGACEICESGYPSKCVRFQFVARTIGTQAEKARIPHADGTLVATPGRPDDELIPSLLAASDVLGTGWFAADAAAAGAAKVKELTGGLGAHSVVEAVGTEESLLQAIRSCRPGGHVGFVGVAHEGVKIPADELFFAEVHLHGGPAPVRRYLPELIRLIWDREIDPGRVFDLALPLERAAEGYRAMHERSAVKVMLTV